MPQDAALDDSNEETSIQIIDEAVSQSGTVNAPVI
jgi:hypothetical protein